MFGGKGQVPNSEYYIPFGQANVLRPGSDLTIVSCGEYVNRCVAAAKELERQGLSCEVIDLRTIVPLDTQTILASVAKTGRLLMVDEAYSMCGVGAEISALVMEEGFDELDAPVGRLHPDPVTQPFAPSLEDSIVVTVEKIITAAKAVASGKPLVPRRPRGVKGRGRAAAVNVAAESSIKARPAAPSHEPRWERTAPSLSLPQGGEGAEGGRGGGSGGQRANPFRGFSHPTGGSCCGGRHPCLDAKPGFNRHRRHSGALAEAGGR